MFGGELPRVFNAVTPGEYVAQLFELLFDVEGSYLKAGFDNLPEPQREARRSHDRPRGVVPSPRCLLAA